MLKTTQEMNVRKRDGRVLTFDPALITRAIQKAFCAEHKFSEISQLDDKLLQVADAITEAVVLEVQEEALTDAGVYAKDVILHIIQKLGVQGGVGYAYEYAGSTFDAMSMEERMTVCNMSIEGGARCGYINPDEKTIEYLKGRPFSPEGEEFDRVDEMHPMPLPVLFVMGFPPERDILRLPVSDQFGLD